MMEIPKNAVSIRRAIKAIAPITAASSQCIFHHRKTIVTLSVPRFQTCAHSLRNKPLTKPSMEYESTPLAKYFACGAMCPARRQP